MRHRTVDKEYRDFADDIEAVSIHYLCVPNGAEADWDRGRVTRFMPLVEPGMRRLRLELPVQLVDPGSGRPVSNYTLLYYFEVYRGGDRHYSQVYSEIVGPGGASATSAQGATHGALPRPRRKRREIR
jgi:hypothetical protein